MKTYIVEFNSQQYELLEHQFRLVQDLLAELNNYTFSIVKDQQQMLAPVDHVPTQTFNSLVRFDVREDTEFNTLTSQIAMLLSEHGIDSCKIEGLLSEQVTFKT